ncbi:hypothetical protein RI129_001940 [Pyrocoelia pectoralis]|uniref:THAP-type domain-containing protein n=1 Tax=Pyrocoelia pectoralis TaxID=417401 RepID=A0AAN7VW09_9COLE
MGKKYHCCIPGCLTYGTINKFVQIPVETEWRNIWLSVIARKDWVVTHSTVACFKHFKSGDFISQSSTVKSYQVTSSTLRLKEGAIPRIFPKTVETPPTELIQLRPLDLPGPELFEDLEKEEYQDFVVALWYIKLMYKKELGKLLSLWKVIERNYDITFYVVDLAEIPRITASIKIDNSLHVCVTLAGREMDPLDLTWVLPVNGKLKRWSQLKTLLKTFSH